jgi:hypothetical protein
MRNRKQVVFLTAEQLEDQADARAPVRRSNCLKARRGRMRFVAQNN